VRQSISHSPEEGKAPLEGGFHVKGRENVDKKSYAARLTWGGGGGDDHNALLKKGGAVRFAMVGEKGGKRGQ